MHFDEAALAILQQYSWPGNVRELENLVERLLIMRTSAEITSADLPDKLRIPHNGAAVGLSVINLPDNGYPLEQLGREVLVEALDRNNWNQTTAARFLQIPRHTLLYRMEKYQITPPKS